MIHYICVDYGEERTVISITDSVRNAYNKGDLKTIAGDKVLTWWDAYYVNFKVDRYIDNDLLLPTCCTAKDSRGITE